MSKMVIGIFPNREKAEEAIYTLEGKGYNPKDFSIILKDRIQTENTTPNTGADLAEGTLSGAATGGIVGGLAGLLVGAGVIPGLGALLIGGPLTIALGLTGLAATTVSGAATGVLAGGIIGALTSLGLSADEARIYEESIKSGGVLVAVPARVGDEEDVRMTMHDFGADQIKLVDATPSKKIDQKEEKYSSAYFSDIDKDEEE